MDAKVLNERRMDDEWINTIMCDVSETGLVERMRGNDCLTIFAGTLDRMMKGNGSIRELLLK